MLSNSFCMSFLGGESNRMIVVNINSVVKGSTGNIMLNIANTVRSMGGKAYTFSERRKNSESLDGHYYFGNYIENMLHRLSSMVTGISGTGSKRGTKELISKIRELNPDVIHLHNLHGWYINIPMLFEYIRESRIPTVWTLHDCWGITAQCSHFTIEKCEKWKSGCYNCPRYKLYPYTLIDKTSQMWGLKKKWLSGIENLTIVTPSVWLSNLVKQSFLKESKIYIINNGINLDIFKPTSSNFRTEHKLHYKKIILGVASAWNNKKGLDVFIKLSQMLDSMFFQVVLVGTNRHIDKYLPKNIIAIPKTKNQKELAQIYTAADVFVNPTREENFPTVNIEALACGTPIVTFNTGGSPEIIDLDTGIVVPQNDIESLSVAVQKMCIQKKFLREVCVSRAKQYEMHGKFAEYYALYNRLACLDRNE